MTLVAGAGNRQAALLSDLIVAYESDAARAWHSSTTPRPAIPAGVSSNIGIGGHVLGGGVGYLCRRHGLVADHLYGVEMVVVDETGAARSADRRVCDVQAPYILNPQLGIHVR
jgi:FAD/FMN-containing dehydrogenase